MSDPVDPADPETERRLRGLITRVLNLREERAGITSDIAVVLKEARDTGFDSRKITEACIWVEKCNKHGRETMVLAEQVYHIYRDVAQGPVRPLAEQFADAKDRALVEIFASPPEEKPKVPKRVKAAEDAAALARAARIARGEG